MLVLPGPAFIVIPIGLGILAVEFAWARRLLKKAKSRFNKQKEGIQSKQKSRVKKKKGVGEIYALASKGSK